MYIPCKRLIAEMLRNGYLNHTISVALGISIQQLCLYIDKDSDLKKARSEGFSWRQQHKLSEWPDFVMEGYMVGTKSKWFDQLPFAGKINDGEHPMVLMSSSASLNLRKHKQRI